MDLNNKDQVDSIYSMLKSPNQEDLDLAIGILENNKLIGAHSQVYYFISEVVNIWENYTNRKGLLSCIIDIGKRYNIEAFNLLKYNEW